MTSETMTILMAVMPVFGIAGVGLVIRKLDWLTEDADQSLLRITINLLMPALILDAALGNPALSGWSNLVLAPLVGFASITIGMLTALTLRRLTGLTDPKVVRTFAVTSGIQNYAYLPLPLAALLFGSAGPATTGVLFVHNVGVEIALWTIGVMILSGGGSGRSWRQIINAPLVAIVLALVLNGLGLPAYVPKPVLTGIHWLGQCAIPMALILIGAVVADHLRELHSDWGWKVVGAAAVVRVGLVPVLILLAARYLPASIELKRVMVLQAAVPSAVFPIVMARHYNGDPPTALRVVIGTSLIGLVTIPLWIRLGLKFVGG